MSHTGTTSPIASGNCSTCHSGAYVSVNAQVKGPTHVSTTAQCDTCHRSTTVWTGATFAHPATATGTCSTCHVAGGASRVFKTATHIPTSAQCDTCHKNYASFKPAVMSHTGTTGPLSTGNCSTCHGGAYISVNALAKPPNHVTTTAQCDTCHRSTTVWTGASFAHPATAAGTCSTCHVAGGASRVFKTATHIPTAAQCDTCHKNFSSFKPAVMSHTGTTGPIAAGNCATCHGGAYTSVNAQAKNQGHFITTRSCDSCHGTTVWSPANTYSHISIGYKAHTFRTCNTCHTTNNEVIAWKNAAYKPDCAGCHASKFGEHQHVKVNSPRLLYTVAELKNCAGSCHEYTNATMTTISKSRTSEHRPTGDW